MEGSTIGAVNHVISSSDEESFSTLLPTLKDWLTTKLGLRDVTPPTVATFLSGGDDKLAKELVGVLRGADEYKLGWVLLEDIVSNKLFKNFGLCFQEKIFIRHLVVKFEMVLVELDFNINVLWRKCGCLTL